jgi:hypothetical protein
MRPARAALVPLWQPVYAQVLADPAGGYSATAQTLLTQITTSGEIAAEGPVRRRLRALSLRAAPREVERRFFIFRPETVAALARLANGASIPVKLLHVGPAMPTSFETDLTTISALPEDRGETLARTVIPGVIDDVIGFANERFRHSIHQTRVERFWMQGMPLINGGRAVIGGEVDRAEIDALLQSQPEESQV